MENNMSKSALMKKIQQLAFVKTELELFLDTHPECGVAMQNFEDTVSALDELYMQYAEKYGPIKSSDSHDSWTWVEGSWPWHGDFPEGNGEKYMKGKGKL